MATITKYSNDPYTTNLNDPNVIVERRPVVKPPVIQPQVVTMPQSCSCNSSGSGFEQKIKENPLLFVLGAVALGYFLAKK